MTAEHDASCAGDGGGRTGFADVCTAFEHAWRGGEAVSINCLLTGQRVRLRVAGNTLARFIGAPFAHLSRDDAEGSPDLTIDLWDVEATGIAAPTLGTEAEQSWTLEDGTLAISSDGSLLRHATPFATLWLDRRDRRIVGWMVAARALPLYERARPLQILLTLCASERGIHAVHGAFVARVGRGVLLAGDSGTGKSTAALRCLQAGFTYLGDDWVGVGRAPDGVAIGHSLYSSVSLEAKQTARFPQLQRHAVLPRGTADLKSLIALADMFPTQLAPSARVSALALPRLIDADESRVRAATKKDALLTMARSAICTMRPRGGREAIAALTRLAQECPAFWLDLGRDLDAIAPRIDEILETVA